MTIPMDALISDGYRALQRELHARPEGYGGKGFKWAPAIVELAKRVGASSVLDYGCGRGSLKVKLHSIQGLILRVAEYDPAVPGKDGRPSFADLVVATDVMEHVEPERLADVLAHIRSLARKAVFFVIALEPANKVMADGRNAHLIQQPREWWLEQLTAAGFAIESADDLPFHAKYDPAVQTKRWILIGRPTC
jgi:hypothetical protein